jgi:regulatory protein
MRTITDITPQVKSASRCNIFLDGEFFCGMSLETVMKNRLKVGSRVDERTLERIQLESEMHTALDKAMTYLSGSVKSEKQVKDYLKEKGFTLPVVNEVCEKLNEYGFLNDGYYAQRYVESYATKKGVRLIRTELRRKGLKEEDVDEAISELGDQSDAALAIAEKYMRGKEPDMKNVQKLYRHLLSKGFTYDDAKSAVDRIKQDEEY